MRRSARAAVSLRDGPRRELGAERRRRALDESGTTAAATSPGAATNSIPTDRTWASYRVRGAFAAGATAAAVGATGRQVRRVGVAAGVAVVGVALSALAAAAAVGDEGA